MPKTKSRPTPPDDVPIWDALLAELGDPRPYEPSEISASYQVADDPFAEEKLDLKTAYAEIDRDVDDFLSYLDDLTYDAYVALDEVYAWPQVQVPHAPVQVQTLIDVDVTQELPRWPS